MTTPATEPAGGPSSAAATDGAPAVPERRRKKKAPAGKPADGGAAGRAPPAPRSSLSAKKRLNLRKSARLTAHSDYGDLLRTGRGLLLALKLFPAASSSCDGGDGDDDGVHNDNDGGVPPPAGLTQHEHAELSSALRRVSVWRARSPRGGGRLSHAVDTTAGLASVLLLDAERSAAGGRGSYEGGNRGAGSHVTTGQLRSAYSAVLLRSVNGLADSYRSQSRSASLSVSHCCVDLAGLPGWVVDLRHDASHNDLPSVGACRLGALESLRFWRARHWDAVEGRLHGPAAERAGEEGGDGDGEEGREAGAFTAAAGVLARYRAAALGEEDGRSGLGGAQKRRRLERSLRRLRERDLRESAGGEPDGGGIEDVPPLGGGGSKPARTRGGSGDEGDDEDADAASANPWAVLEDRPRKKKKRKANADGEDGEKPRAASGPGGAPSDGTGRGHAAAEEGTADESPRDVAAEFVRTVPADVAYPSFLRYLVWGGVVPAEGGDGGPAHDSRDFEGPALLGGPFLLDGDQPSNGGGGDDGGLESSFQLLRRLNEPLVLHLVGAYPGLLPGLFVHVIESFVCLAAGGCSDGGREADVGAAGRAAALLARWASYLLSREFHMHADRSAALLPVDLPSLKKRTCLDPSVDLKKKGRRRWTPAEADYMRGPVGRDALSAAGVPLNSVCDRLVDEVVGSSGGGGDGAAGRAAEGLVGLLEGILGEDRVVRMGLPLPPLAGAGDGRPERDRGGGGPSPGDVPGGGGAGGMSLEDMESMLRGDAAGDGPDADPGDEDGGPATPNGGGDDGEAAPALRPWTLCASWDPCQIGTLPGHAVLP